MDLEFREDFSPFWEDFQVSDGSDDDDADGTNAHRAWVANQWRMLCHSIRPDAIKSEK
jgi:hypothetical protein